MLKSKFPLSRASRNYTGLVKKCLNTTLEQPVPGRVHVDDCAQRY